jgi:hypothetical protein
MPLDLADSRIDQRAEKYQNMLQNLQGNNLKAEGR